MRDQINNVGDFVGNLLAQFVDIIPEVLGAGLILLIGYFVAKALCKVVDGLLDRVNFDERVHTTHGGSMIKKAVPYPSDLLGKSVFWILFLFAISTAVSVLGIPLLTAMVMAIYAYIPNVIASVLIFLVAGTLAGGVTGLVQRTMGETPTGKIVKTVAPVVIMSIAGFMILNQLMIAPAIVTMTYAAIVGSAGLGLALAFGLGGRETAARLVSGAYDKTAKMQEDVQVGQQRATEQVREVKRRRF